MAVRKLVPWAVPVALLLAVGVTIASLLDIANTLPTEIEAAFRHEPPPLDYSRGVSLVIVHEPPTGALRGIQLVLIGLVLGPIPGALAAAVLSRARRHSTGRPPAALRDVFFGAWVFHLCSLLLTSVLLGVVLWAYAESEASPLRVHAAYLAAAVVANAWALRAWRRLSAGGGDRTHTAFWARGF